MLFKQWLALAALVSVPVAAAAQQHEQHASGDPAAPAAAIAYESAFKNYRAADGSGDRDGNGGTPDKAWRAANDEVGKLGGHAAQMTEMKDIAPKRSPSFGTETSNHETNHRKHH